MSATACRTVILVVLALLLQGQWALAAHDHADRGSSNDACEVCLHAQHGKTLPALFALPSDRFTHVEHEAPCAQPAFCTIPAALARGPPVSLPA